MTPVSAVSFAALQDAIIKRSARTLDEVDQKKLERHIGKLAKAAQVFMARTTLQENHIRFLLDVNDEAQTRRSTRSLVLGTAKVMSDEDLKAAYAKRREQEEKANARREKLAQARAKRSEQEIQGRVTKSKKRLRSQNRGTESRMAQELDMASETSHTSCEQDAVVDANQGATENHLRGPISPCPGNAPVARMW